MAILLHQHQNYKLVHVVAAWSLNYNHSAITKEDVNGNKKFTIKSLIWHYPTMRSMKNVTVFTEDRAFALFFRPHPGGFDSSTVSTPGNLPSKAKKMLMPRGQSGGGTGHSWNWRMHYRRGLQTDYNTKNLYQAEKPSPSEPRNHQTLTWTNLTDDEPVPCKRDNWDQSILVLQKLWLETMTMKVSMPKSQKTLLIAVNFITSENENCIFLPQITLRLRSKGQWPIKLAFPAVQRQLIFRAFPKSDTPQNHLW